MQDQGRMERVDLFEEVQEQKRKEVQGVQVGRWEVHKLCPNDGATQTEEEMMDGKDKAIVVLIGIGLLSILIVHSHKPAPAVAKQPVDYVLAIMDKDCTDRGKEFIGNTQKLQRQMAAIKTLCDSVVSQANAINSNMTSKINAQAAYIRLVAEAVDANRQRIDRVEGTNTVSQPVPKN